jgi:hypothetical protein
MMRFFAFFLFIWMLFLAGCATTKAPTLAERFPNLIEISPPSRVPYVEKKIAIKLVEPILVGKKTALHIQGTLPTGCTGLLHVNDKWLPEILELKMVGWQKARETCKEPSVPFSYIFTDMSPEQWQQIKMITVNGKEFKFHESATN